jgi:hypothetical protein
MEIPKWIVVHKGNFVMFRHKVQEFLNIEQFCQKKIKKIKTKKMKEIGVHSLYC